MRNVLIVLFSVLVCNQSFASIIGNDIIDRTTLDSATNINFVDTTLAFDNNGIITSWDIYAGRASSEFALQVFRATGNANEFSLIGENYFSAAGGLGLVHFDIPVTEQILVQSGDLIGWWFGSGAGVIDFDGTNADPVNWKSESGTPVNVGDSVVMGSSGNREYSIRANYTAVPEPTLITLFGLGIFAIGLMTRNRKA